MAGGQGSGLAKWPVIGASSSERNAESEARSLGLDTQKDSKSCQGLWQRLACSLLPQPAWTWFLLTIVEGGGLRTQRYLLHGEWLGVSYLPSWSPTPYPWPKLNGVLGPESPAGHLQMGFSGHPGLVTCSLTWAIASCSLWHMTCQSSPHGCCTRVSKAPSLPHSVSASVLSSSRT